VCTCKFGKGRRFSDDFIFVNIVFLKGKMYDSFQIEFVEDCVFVFLSNGNKHAEYSDTLLYWIWWFI